MKQLQEKGAAGDAKAQYDLGNWYTLSEDHTEASLWYRKASQQGNAKAQFSLGLKYSNGIGVPQSYAEAVRLYRQAAKQGHAMAQFFLGNVYAYGEGLPPNYADAYVWLSLAAAAQSSNGEMRNFRDQVARLLTPAQLAVAQAMSQQCLETNYAKCDSTDH